MPRTGTNPTHQCSCFCAYLKPFGLFQVYSILAGNIYTKSWCLEYKGGGVGTGVLCCNGHYTRLLLTLLAQVV